MSLALGHGHDATTGWLRLDRGAVRRRLHVHAPHGPTGFGGRAGGARGVRRGRWRLGRVRLPHDSPARRRHACDHQLDAGGTRRPLCAGRCLRRDGRRTDQAVVAGGSRLFGHAVRARRARRRRHRRRGRRARRALFGASQGSDPAPVRMCTDYDGGSICTTTGLNGLSAGEKATATGLAFGLIGAGVGALVGYSTGHTDRFEF